MKMLSPNHWATREFLRGTFTPSAVAKVERCHHSWIFLILACGSLYKKCFFFPIAFAIKSLSVPFKNIRKYRSAKEQWIQISVHVCSGLPFPPPKFLPHPGIKPLSPASPALQVEVDSLPLSYWGRLVPPLFPPVFIYLAAPGLICSMQTVGCGIHSGSTSLTRG